MYKRVLFHFMYKMKVFARTEILLMFTKDKTRNDGNNVHVFTYSVNWVDVFF